MRLLLPATACLALAALTACSSGGGTSLPPPTTSSTTTAATSDSSSAPQVSNPKNIKGTDPCQLLTTTQLVELGGTATPKKDNSAWGAAECSWDNDNLGMTVAPETASGRGIAQTYSNRANFSSFQPSQVDGYPDVRTDLQSLSCVIFVGVSNTQALSVSYTRYGATGAEYMDPCGFAEKVAGMVLSNLPAAS
jgi:hypothetical protein